MKILSFVSLIMLHINYCISQVPGSKFYNGSYYSDSCLIEISLIIVPFHGQDSMFQVNLIQANRCKNHYGRFYQNVGYIIADTLYLATDLNTYNYNQKTPLNNWSSSIRVRSISNLEYTIKQDSIMLALSDEPVSYESPMDFAEVHPQFPGGDKALADFIQNNLQLPKKKIKSAVVQVEFTIEADGSLTNIEISVGAKKWMNSEAVRLVSIMPKWQPAERAGKKISEVYNLEIRFEKS